MTNSPLAVLAGLIIDVVADELAVLECLHQHLLIHKWVQREREADIAAAAEIEIELPQVACFLAQVHLPQHTERYKDGSL